MQRTPLHVRPLVRVLAVVAAALGLAVAGAWLVPGADAPVPAADVSVHSDSARTDARDDSARDPSRASEGREPVPQILSRTLNNQQAMASAVAKEKAQARAAEEAARKAAEEEAARKKAAEQEAARKRAAEEEAARKRAAEQEAARKRAAEEEAARKRAAEEEAARKRAAEEEAARQRAAEEEARENAVGDPRSAARSMMSDYGWGSDQFRCLDDLWTRESNWDHTAMNPSSGAYGIPQALPGGKMASAGDDWQTNPVTQIRWGLGYINDRYGSPCAAWSHSQATNWY